MRSRLLRVRHAAPTILPLLALLAGAAAPAQPVPGPGPRPEGARAKLETPLRRHLASIRPDEEVPVLVLVGAVLTDRERVAAFEPAAATGAEPCSTPWRAAVVEALQDRARDRQRLLLDLLARLERAGEVSGIRPHWIVDAVGLRATRAALDRIASLAPVASVSLDLPRPVKADATWNVAQVGAAALHAGTPSLDGTGVVVAIVDTGVDYDHECLKDRLWVNEAEDVDGDGRRSAADDDDSDADGNGHPDDVVGWNFLDDDDDPIDEHGHGTAVAGIVAAGPCFGDEIAVAPGAKLMALRESNAAGASTQDAAIAAIEYAIEHDARIVNYSSGWPEFWADGSAPKHGQWRNLVRLSMDLCTLFVAPAGGITVRSDEWPIPFEVTTPGRAPAALTVGSTGQDGQIPNDDYVRSNEGPVTWQAVAPWTDYRWPPGLMKPDLAAPGVAVTSVSRGGGSESKSGVSFATPHAAGAAALLLQQDPARDAYDLRYLLEETAAEVGVPGPDDASGWGRLDVAAAAATSIAPEPYDLAITQTNELWTTADIWVDNDDDGSEDTPVALSANHLYARVRNLGGRVVSNPVLSFWYDDVATTGIGHFDPDGDGDPSDGGFQYIGSYEVPLLGPKGSAHDTAVGVVHWEIPVPTGDHWCVGVGVHATAPNEAEADPADNRAFRNFFEILTTTGGLTFMIRPPAPAPEAPFALEIVPRGLPRGSRVGIAFDPAFEGKEIAGEFTGLVKVDPLERDPKGMGERYQEALRRERPWVRFEVRAGRGVLPVIRSPRGADLPARLWFQVPPDADLTDARIVVNTRDERGARAGGLTVKPVHPAPTRRGGPWRPR